MAIRLTYSRLMKEQAALKQLESEFNKQKKVVEQLREDMLSELHDAGTDTYKSDLGSISVLKQQVPNVKDWDAFYNYILENKALDLLQRRVSTSAWRDRVEDTEQPMPGVEVFEKETLRITLKK